MSYLLFFLKTIWYTELWQKDAVYMNKNINFDD